MAPAGGAPVNMRRAWLVLALAGAQGCAQIAGIEEIKPLSSRAKQEPEGGSDQGGSDQGGGDQGGSGGAAGKGGKSQGGAVNTGATGGTGAGSGGSPGGKGGSAGKGGSGGEPALCVEGGPSYTGANACSDCQNATSSLCCSEELDACAKLADCSSLASCINACVDSSCQDACVGFYSKGYDTYAALLTCVAGDGAKQVGACGLACKGAGGSGGAGGSAGTGSTGTGSTGTGGASGKCNDGGAGFTGANACTDCVFQADAAGGCCAPRVDACEEDIPCSALQTCYSNCQSGQACIDKCSKDNPAGMKLYNELLDCLYGAGGGLGACGKVCQ